MADLNARDPNARDLNARDVNARENFENDQFGQSAARETATEQERPGALDYDASQLATRR